MRINPHCYLCHFEKQVKRALQLPDEQMQTEYLRRVCAIIADSDENTSSPVLSTRFHDLWREIGCVPEDYTAVKHEFNQLMLSLLPTLEATLLRQPDPLYAALQYAIAGNYVDFQALPNVEQSTLLQILDQALNWQLSSETYTAFRSQLSVAKTLTLLADNCGEIVTDLLLMRQLARDYPALRLTVVVRGGIVVNDACMDDAEEIGMTREFRVVPNGTPYPGTELAALPADLRRELEATDLLISKGQGNFETLQGCGLNIYYLFLCKCSLFMRRFQAKQNEPKFVREQDIHFYHD